LEELAIGWMPQCPRTCHRPPITLPGEIPHNGQKHCHWNKKVMQKFKGFCRHRQVATSSSSGFRLHVNFP
jgi:hypothetical protein